MSGQYSLDTLYFLNDWRILECRFKKYNKDIKVVDAKKYFTKQLFIPTWL